MFTYKVPLANNFYKKLTLMLIFALLASHALPFKNSENHVAQASTEKDIRVALYVNIGKFYQQTVPVISLSNPSGFEFQGESGPFQNIGGETYVRFSLDQFYLIVEETTQAADARAMIHRLEQQKLNGSIMELKKNGATLYRVISSSEPNATALYALQQEIKKKLNIEALPAGPLRVEAGSFPTLEEARKRLDEIQLKEFTAYLVQVRSGKSLSYQVWVGDQVDASSQQDLQARLEKTFPKLQFQPASATEYMIYTSTPLFNGQGGGVPLYLLSPTKKVIINPSNKGEASLTKVEEKANRTYRGKFELSRHNSHFTVINILPLEHYLYSVVGTEMATGWPIEALKTQAIMSRNYAFIYIEQNKYGIAHVSDSVYDQAYHGFKNEAADVRKAVDETAGELITYKGKVFSTFYYSNAGGMTADGQEVWKNSLETHSIVTSKDQFPEERAAIWYRVQDMTGKIGYAHSQYITKSVMRSALGYVIGTVNVASLNYRSGPSADHILIGSLASNDQVIILEELKENNSYSWISGPISGFEAREAINNRSIQSSQPIYFQLSHYR